MLPLYSIKSNMEFGKKKLNFRPESTSFEEVDPRLFYLNTSPSLKSSVISQFKSSLFERKEESTLKYHLYSPPSLEKSQQLRDTEADSSVRFDTIEDTCTLPVSPQRYVGNFQKNYLDSGQWPDSATEDPLLKKKYQTLQKECYKSEAARLRLESELEAYRKGKIDCGNCKILKEKNRKTKIALDEAVQLSSMLLNEVHRLDCELRSPDFLPRYSKKVKFSGQKM